MQRCTLWASVLLGTLGLAGCQTMTRPLTTSDTSSFQEKQAKRETTQADKGNAQIEESNAGHVTTPTPATRANRFITLTPFTSLENQWDTDAAQGARGGIFSNAYTRLVITSRLAPVQHDETGDGTAATNSAGGKDLDYHYKSRNWLARALFGQDYGINFSAKVTSGPFEATVPLVTISHHSNYSDGESWSRTVYHTAQSFPLFLVRQDGGNLTPSIKVSMRISKDFTSHAAAATVGIAAGVIKVVAPTSSVLTTLTEQSSKDKANVLDQTLGKLFSSSITEEHWSDQDMRTWQYGKGVQVGLEIPETEDAKFDKPAPVGDWVVSFDDPRPSIFSDWRICVPMSVNGVRPVPQGTAEPGTDPQLRCAKTRELALRMARAAVKPEEVLAYSLVDGDAKPLGTIRAYLAQKDWYASSLNDLADPAKHTAAIFCRRIRSAITELDLNGDDADIVVWAAINGMPLDQKVVDNLKGDADCWGSLQRVKPGQAPTEPAAVAALPAAKKSKAKPKAAVAKPNDAKSTEPKAAKP